MSPARTSYPIMIYEWKGILNDHYMFDFHFHRDLDPTEVDGSDPLPAGFLKKGDVPGA